MKYELATLSWDEKEKEAIKKIIDSDMYTMGENVYKFEEMFSQYVGSKYAVMVNSGSSANLLMIASLFYSKTFNIKRGDEVIVPAVSWSTTYMPLKQYGLKLKFIDIDINTLNFNITQLEKAVTDKTKIILAVNLLGNPNDFNSINKIIANKNIILLEDNCESLGAVYYGKQLGTFGIMGTYSTFFSHHMTTMEGGVIVTDNEELYHILLCLRAHGWTRQLPKNNKLCIKSDNPFEESFRFILPGYNVRPIEMSGAIGIEQLKKLPNFITERRKNAAYFTNKFSNDKRFIIQKEIEKSSWFGFSFIIKDNSGISRKDIINKLISNNIEVRPIVSGNFLKNEVIKYFDYEIFENVHNAELLDKNGFFVGNHHFDIRDKIDYLEKILMEFK
ncbi:DegT/DnrJ/EryC1/StrS family aminotransferase [Brachyspira hampsonii]|uniref:DegT/DnrJ/EryC1/StrS aminotransferase n=1 Tax=Brachyspira hampsonii 30446 TaxID=1289135 RepID=A0A2U4EXN4_9SPIR|nr:DegT/DnrJ/EryC1/StrS family aminotransferase [Brachyspira hampsonii]EKV58028.1 DegT/DnrJ/EryC1/StrS aminotransferase [Brachyspira hampsonii 30446]MBW5390713.1 DegT/DnrJ/EryC1/StrS family aminotransferase [Brachyspira hampsonii]MBW5393596.1 DegT/DnrJ/EryC1/StrS family aminotransferase [Brachyspira hampsonii]OEJ16722.1 pyridoxamine 5-phosphate oxidase [Brachyspira hampsonii]